MPFIAFARRKPIKRKLWAESRMEQRETERKVLKR